MQHNYTKLSLNLVIASTLVNNEQASVLIRFINIIHKICTIYKTSLGSFCLMPHVIVDITDIPFQGVVKVQHKKIHI